MRKKITYCLIILVCFFMMALSSCGKTLGPDDKIPLPGSDSDSNSESNTTSDTITPEPTITDMVTPEPTKEENQKENTDNLEENKKGDVSIRINGTNIYFNETLVEKYSVNDLNSLIKSYLGEKGSIYLYDGDGDYRLSETVRKDIESLGYSPIIING